MSRIPSFSRPPPQQFKARRPQPVAEVLNRTDAFAALRAGVEQIAALEKDLRALLPDYLATSVEPGFIKEGVLALFAGHNALAARLRHIEPRLLSDLQQRGWPVNALRIRVRPQAVQGTAAGQTGAHVAGRRRRAPHAERIAGAVAAYRKRWRKWRPGIGEIARQKNKRRRLGRLLFVRLLRKTSPECVRQKPSGSRRRNRAVPSACRRT